MKIKNESELRDIYGTPSERARKKVLSQLDKHAKHYIKTSPFFVLCTYNNAGNPDASPRGGEPGFVKILNDTQIVIPDFKGNNRIDSLVNIVESGKAGLLFLIPGIDETLRVNGNAYITQNPEILQLFSSESKLPISCIVVTAEEIFLHCAKAFMRSKLWRNEAQISQEDFPTMGQMLKDQMGLNIKPESREDMIKRYQKDI